MSGTISRAPVPAAGMIPHAKPMLLADAVLEAGGDRGVVRGAPSADWPLVGPGGEVAPEACIELAAQAYAALRGLARAAGAPGPSHGYLVGIQEFTILGPARLGDELLVEVSTVGEYAGFAVVEARVCRKGAVLAQGRIKVWIPGGGPDA